MNKTLPLIVSCILLYGFTSKLILKLRYQCITLIFILLLPKYGSAQYNNTSVDLVTGTMSTDIPLFTMTSGDLQVPGTLTYTANGVRVTDDDGMVGHNWSLSVLNFRVSREVRSLPDDLQETGANARTGWLYGDMATRIKNFTATSDNNLATCNDEISNYDFLNTFSYKQDTEPDAFHVRAPGLSFDFYFDETGTPRVVPYQDVKITSVISGQIFSFTITDAQGVIYEFKEKESVTESIQEPSAHYLVRRSHLFQAPITYVTSWYLSKITSPVRGEIGFTYKTINSDNSNLYPDWYKKTNAYKYRYPINFTNSSGAQGKIAYSRTLILKVLTGMSSSTMNVNFDSSPKDGTVLERLNTITVYELGALMKTFTFTNAFASDTRNFLAVLDEKIGNDVQTYRFFYHGFDLPAFDSKNKDDWGFYKDTDTFSAQRFYNETVIKGSLMRVVYPTQGYQIFFYEPHEYRDGTTTTTVQGGGIRLRRMVTYDGGTGANDIIKNYEYKLADGSCSGKLQYQPIKSFPVAVVDRYAPNYLNIYLNLRFRDAQNLSSVPIAPDGIFSVKPDEELSYPTLLHGSVVAYERVTVKVPNQGRTVYDFELPASYGDGATTDGEWQPSLVSVARPSTGTSACYEIPYVQEGFNKYPFPAQSNYEFVRGLLKKVTDYSESNALVREVSYNYQRVYGGSAIRKIYGLSLEELPTYYYDGSYHDSKMFLYSKYPVLTDVKIELAKQTEWVYHPAEANRRTENIIEYFYDSPNHRELCRTVKQNSDHSQIVTKFRYANDYTVGSLTNDPQCSALDGLNKAHRTGTVIETISSRISGSVEKYVGASLTTFQSVNTKIYPYKQYDFVSTEGLDVFTPSSIVTASGNSTFNFEKTKYTLKKTYLLFNDDGNPQETVGPDRKVNTMLWGYNGVLPLLQIEDAYTSEIAFSNFEGRWETTANFQYSWYGPPTQPGRNNSTSINFPYSTSPTSYNPLTRQITNKRSKNYFLSCWIKTKPGGTTGAFKIFLKHSGGTITKEFVFTANSTDWKYFKFSVPTNTITDATFTVELVTGIPIQIDDLAFYPDHCNWTSFTYDTFYRKSSQTDSRGNFFLYSYDERSRLKAVYDRDGNILTSYNYQIK